jgi:cellulose synthase/poly-beta-1,6-N-acetylglucosamine synthase-like glycosyltransferase
MLWVELIFWIGVLVLFYTYVLYPAMLALLDSGHRKGQEPVLPEELPLVSVLMAAYNEEEVIEKKIESVFKSDYPADRLVMWVGSDGSTDKTDEIVQGIIDRGLNVRLRKFGGRNGKSNILNSLRTEAEPGIWIPTDANIMFSPGLIPRLVSGFRNGRVGIVGAEVINSGQRADGISFQESSYISRENRIKAREGRLWGAMMGAFGACYAIRSELFPPIPPNYLMEDFYITMHVLNEGFQATADEEAICYEDVSNKVEEEFKRKIRISAGNYQNLAAWKGLLWPPSIVAFAFLSHKILRWMGPWAILLSLLAAIALAIDGNLFYSLSLGAMLFLLFSPVLDSLLARLGIHIRLLRFIGYFCSMNIALAIGLFKYLSGVSTNAWEPTQRNQ